MTDLPPPAPSSAGLGADPARAAADPARAAAEPRSRFDRWTSVLFLVLAAVTLVATLTVLTVAQGAGPGVFGSVVGASAATIAILVGAAMALDRGMPWASTAAVGLLVVIVVTDTISVLVGLTRSTITIPLAGIVALYLLSILPGPLPRLAGRDRSTALLVVGAYALVEVAELAGALARAGSGSTIP